MTPLTLDCTHVQQQLGAYRDGELPADVAERVAEHLGSCADCGQALARLEAALVALKTLSGRDVDRLRAEATPFDPRPLTTLIGVGAVVLIAALIGLVALAFRDRPEPASPAAPAPAPAAPSALVLPSVGAVVGIEEDLAWLPPARETDPAALPEPEPQPVVVAGAPAEAPEEEPVAVVVPEPDPEPMAAAPAAAKPKNTAKQPEPLPLPDAVANALARYKVGDGIGYKGLELYFVVDPTARDRLGGGSLALVQAKEDRPPRPDRLQLDPPRGARRYVGLVGEVVEAPFGLRVLIASGAFGSDAQEVHPISFDGLTRRATPLLKGPLVLPSVARKELILGRRSEAVAELLQLLNDPTLLEFRRLRDELARLESDARELERRLRGLLAGQRGLRGVGYSVGNDPRALDLFPSATRLGAALPRLLRAALLEEALASAAERNPADVLADSRPRTLTPGRKTTLKAHQAWLQLTRVATAPPGSPRFTAQIQGSACELRVERGELVHGACF